VIVARPRYIRLMTRLLEQAVQTVSALPDDLQDQFASILLQLAGVEQPPIPLTVEEEADLDASLAEAERGEFATDDEVRAIWAKYGR
jgi:predicted transcriptional regulator